MDKIDQRIEDVKEDIICVRGKLSDKIDEILNFTPDTKYRMRKFRDYLNQMNSCIVGEFVFKPARVLEVMNREAFRKMFSEFVVDEEDLLNDNKKFIQLKREQGDFEDTLEELRGIRNKLIEEKRNGPGNKT